METLKINACTNTRGVQLIKVLYNWERLIMVAPGDPKKRKKKHTHKGEKVEDIV